MYAAVKVYVELRVTKWPLESYPRRLGLLNYLAVEGGAALLPPRVPARGPITPTRPLHFPSKDEAATPTP